MSLRPPRRPSPALRCLCAPLLAAALALAALGASAQAPAGAPGRAMAAVGGTDWSALTAAERQRLAPLQAEWPRIDDARRRKWLEVAARLPTMPPAEQARIRERMATWAAMTPVERGRARVQFQESLRFNPNPDDRRAAWEAYQALPEDQRRSLVERAKPQARADRPAGTQARNTPASGEKRNIVAVPAARSPSSARTVSSPAVVQAKPGATTRLLSTQPQPPVHHQAGLPKIAVTPNFVDRATLLPLRGPQGAATRTEPPVEPDPEPVE